uniref:Metalloendopeptidase n=1 Tax=Globodera pallida TaxID=36090 RepID=A0A183BY23_GLOPA
MASTEPKSFVFTSRNKLGRSYNPGRPLGMLDRQKILNLYQKGLKISHIAKLIGVTHSCVSKIMTRYRRTGSIYPRSAQLIHRRHHHQQQCSPISLNDSSTNAMDLAAELNLERLVYGDILLSPRQIKLSRLLKSKQMAKHIALKSKQNNRWTNNEIPFIFSAKFNERQKRAIREALAVLEDSSCFRFIPRSNQRDFLFFDMREGCFSFVGKVGGRQLLSLAAGCLHDYIIWHEVMHALGLEHEHQRPDRDRFIRIHWENVEADKHLNFEKIPQTDVDLYHNYDYHSLMHYDGTAFGKTDRGTGEPMMTMEPLRDGVQLTDNFELTRFDVEKLQILSNCNPSSKLLTDPGTGERTVTECADRSANCRTLKENGFCWEIRYVRLIRIQCQHTCGFCEGHGGPNKPDHAKLVGQNELGKIEPGQHGHDNSVAKIVGKNELGKIEPGQDGHDNSVAKIVGQDEDYYSSGNTDGQDEEEEDNVSEQKNGQDELDKAKESGQTGHRKSLTANKKKKKKLLLETSEEAGDEALGHRKLLKRVDEHYTKWTFPKRRPDDQSANGEGGEDEI